MSKPEGLQKLLLTAAVVAMGVMAGYCTVHRGVFMPEALYAQPPSAPPGSTPETPLRVRPALTVRPDQPSDTTSNTLDGDAPPFEGSLPSVIEPVWIEPYHPFLDDEPHDVSVSIGTTTEGYLVNARILPLPGKTYDILPRQRERGLNYGTDEMIDLLVHASGVLWRLHGRRLWLGNIGRRGGGDIPWSVSHNTGRDADIAFCYTNPQGHPVDPPDLLQVDKNGRSTSHNGYYRFDPARTWTLVRALLTVNKAQIQYLFIASPLKKMLLDHARKKGEPGHLVARADKILVQPSHASPHDDHLHLRIFCSLKDVLGGCVNGGTVHNGTNLHKAALAERIQLVANNKLRSPTPEIRARSIERLVLLGANNRLPDILARLNDDEPRVRAAASTAIGQIGNASHAHDLMARFDHEADPSAKVAFLDALQTIGGGQTGDFLARVIADPAYDHMYSGPLPASIVASYTRPPPKVVLAPEEIPEEEVGIAPALLLSVKEPKFSGFELSAISRGLSVRLAAIEAAADSDRPEPVRPLIGALLHEDPVVRGRAARALSRLTNHTIGFAWDDPSLTPEALEAAVEPWHRWIERHGNQDRNAWLAAGFLNAGYDIPAIDRRHIWELVRAITDDDHLSFNAQRALMAIANHPTQSLLWRRSDATWHWVRFFSRRRGQFRLGPPPSGLTNFER